MGKIYCVMGKSSSGKDTVYKKLKEQYKEFRLIVPYTTRPIREGEKDGVEYYFVDPEQFRAMKRDFGRVWNYFGAEKMNQVIGLMREQEQTVKQKPQKSRENSVEL